MPNFVKATSKPKPPPPTADKPSHPLPNLAPVIGGAKYREPGVLPPASGASQGAAPALAHIPQVISDWLLIIPLTSDWLGGSLLVAL